MVTDIINETKQLRLQNDAIMRGMVLLNNKMNSLMLLYSNKNEDLINNQVTNVKSKNIYDQKMINEKLGHLPVQTLPDLIHLNEKLKNEDSGDRSTVFKELVRKILFIY